MRTMFCILLLSFSMFVPTNGFSAEKIGHIQTLKGTASILQGNLTLPAKIGEAVHEGDRVRTYKESSVGIVLNDDTTLSLGPSSELVIKQYAFDPKEGKFAFLARMIKGTFIYFSGLIGKLSPNAIQLEIPDATIAVRGTRLLVAVQE